jgi:hypothetical protein
VRSGSIDRSGFAPGVWTRRILLPYGLTGFTVEPADLPPLLVLKNPRALKISFRRRVAKVPTSAHGGDAHSTGDFVSVGN